MHPVSPAPMRKPTYTHEADYRQERAFGAKVSATFDFITAQFRPLMKCVAYFVVPGALLGGIGFGLVMGDFMKLMPKMGTNGPVPMAQNYPNANPFGADSYLGMGLAMVGFLVAFLLLSSTVYAFVRVRLATPAAEVVQPRQVWAHMAPRLGRVLGAWLLLIVLMGGSLALVGGALGLLGPGFVVLLFGPLMWAGVCLTLFFPALWLEDGSLFSTLRRSFYLIKGKWWSSLGLYMVMSMVTGILNYIFIIPFYALMMGRMMLHWSGLDSKILSIAALSIYALGWVFTAVLPLVAMLFQYFSQVERKEGVGLRLLVHSLGQSAAPQVTGLTYQPDEEGEY